METAYAFQALGLLLIAGSAASIGYEFAKWKMLRTADPKRWVNGYISQGKRGQYRFVIETMDGESLALSMVNGYDTRAQAADVLYQLSRSQIRIMDKEATNEKDCQRGIAGGY